MRFRKLRIAWSVFWGVACLLLIVLWVRSYWWNDLLLIQTKPGLVQIQSMRGRLNYIENVPSPTRMPLPSIFIHQWIRDQHPDPAYDWQAKWPTWGLVHNPPGFVTPTTLFTIPTW